MSSIKNIKDARNAIGKMVYWKERDSARYYGMERCGMLERVECKNVCISGNWLWRTDLINFGTEPPIKTTNT